MAWIVLLASLVVTFFVWYLARGVALERANDRFVFQCQAIESALRERLRACEFLLQSGAGLFAGSEDVTRAEWRTYVTALQIDKHYQGVQGLGFSKRILSAEKKTHIRQIREEGFPDYDIHPDGERPEYTSIIFLEPFDWRNQRAFGYDMFSEPTRKEAMVMARDTGSAALSGKVTLLQETEKDVQAGFLMYLPVYRNEKVAETPEQRREALTGYIYSPFRMNDLMQGLLIEKRGDVELQVFDGDEPLEEALLYPSKNMESRLSPSDHVHFATCQSILEYAGRRWLLVFKSTPYFEESIDTGQVNSILLLGIIISLLLFAVVLSLTKSRNQALSLADMTLDLEKVNLGLRREIEARKQGEEKIRQLNDELEEKVRARTQQLVESQSLLSTVFDSVQDGIVLVDTETRQFRMSNTSLQRMLGYSADEILALGVEDIHPKEEIDNVNRQFERQIKQKNSLAPNIPVKRKDGSTFYADINTSVMKVKETSFLLAVFTDITERRQSEQTLRHSEEKFHAMSASAQDAIIIIDHTGNISFWNAAAEKILGYSSQEVLGKNLHALIAPERFHEAHRKGFEHFQQTGEGTAIGTTLELIALHRDGSEFPVELSLSAVSIGNQWHALGIIRDITERKQVEQTLRQSEHFLDTLLNAIPVPVFYKDREGRYLGFNKAYETFFGATRDQLIGKSVFDISPPELAKIYHAKDAELFESRGMQQYESQVKNSHGSLRDVIFSKAVFTDSQGVVSGLIGAILDITERKQAVLGLQENERKYRGLFENSRDAMMVHIPPSWRFGDANQSALQMFGVASKADFAALGPWDISPERQPDGRLSAKVASEMIATTLREGSHAFEWESQRLNGEPFASDMLLTRIESGDQISLQCTVRDISERKQAQQALSDSEELLRTIFDSVQDGIIVADAQTRQFRMVNASICRMLGYHRDELLSLGVEGIHPAEELAYIFSQFELQARGEISVVPSMPMKRKDGSIFYADVNTGPMMAHGVASIVGVFRDITERIRAEEQQRLALLYARSLIEADMDPLVTINVAGKIMDVNEAAIQMTGVSRELLTDSDFSEYFTEPDRAHAGYQEAFAKGFIRDYPLTMRHASGTLTEVLYNASVYRNEQGETVGVLAVARDITERLRAEQAEELASRDGLTGLYNHRTFYALLNDEIFRTQRFNHPLSLLMLDIDHFKRVNDTHGHQVGDAILKDISDLLVKQARAVDRVCRYGGEEITVILPETDANLAMNIAERLRTEVELHAFDIGDGKTADITVSIGVATYLQQANSLEALVKAADVALYAAKQAGRNRVCRYETEMNIIGIKG